MIVRNDHFWDVEMIICWNVEDVLDWNADDWFWWNNQNCIWCWCHQMHWRLSDARSAAFDSEWSDALTKLSDAENAAPDPKAIRCTDEIVWLSGLLHPTPSGQMHWRNCLTARTASDAKTIWCTGDFFWCRRCCTRCWDHRVHWRNYLIVRTAAPDPERSDALTKLFNVENAAPDSEWSDALAKLSDFSLAIRLKAGKLLTDVLAIKL